LIDVNAIAAKQNLLDLDREGLERFFADTLGEKRFRAHQVMKWMYHRHVTDFNEMTDLGKVLRGKLEEYAQVLPPNTMFEKPSADGTHKWLLAMGVDGKNAIETVYIPDKTRGTLCVSSQVGCSLDCSFCSTGKQGFQRDLSSAEIIGQVWIAAGAFGLPKKGGQRRITNVVMMGMGEPLLNFDNVVTATDLMMDDFAYGISKRRVTLSTAGVVPALDRLAKLSEVSLAISLHAPNDALRDQLVPVNRRYPIRELLASARNYIGAQSDTKRVVTVEYTLISEVNDRPEHAHELAALLRDYPCKINLIPFNPFDASDYRRPSRNAVSRFWNILTEAGLRVTVRSTRGDDIDAACGQLVGRVDDRTRRSERHRAARAKPAVAGAA
jgi:23S rRNA (adenine2503-C2)-methyltransferase